jgi:hypothetical protein
LRQHVARLAKARGNHRIQNFVLGLEVMIEIAARNVHHLRNVGERSGLETSRVEQLVRSVHDLLAGGLVGHGGHLQSGISCN